MSRRWSRLLATAAGIAALVVGVPAIAGLVSASAVAPQISLNTATPAFTFDGLLPGATMTRCIRARNEGAEDIDLASTMSVTGGLAPYLRVVAERGSGLGDVGPSCAGFVASGGYAYGSSASGTMPSSLTTESVTGLAAQATRSLRITVSVPATTGIAAAAKEATVTLAFAGTAIPDPPSGGGTTTPAPAPTTTPAATTTPTTTAPAPPRPPAPARPAPPPSATAVAPAVPTPPPAPTGGVAGGTEGGYDINGNFLSNSTIKKRLRIGKARLLENGNIVVRMFLPAGGAIRAKAILPNGVYYAHTLRPVEWGPTVTILLKRRAVGRAAASTARRTNKALTLRITTRYRWAHGPHAFVQPEQKLVVVKRRR